MKCLKPKRKYLFLSQNELYIYKKCYLFLTAYAESSGPTSRNFPAPVLKMWCQVLQPLPPKKPWLTSRPWKTSTKWKCRKQKKQKDRVENNQTKQTHRRLQLNHLPLPLLPLLHRQRVRNLQMICLCQKGKIKPEKEPGRDPELDLPVPATPIIDFKNECCFLRMSCYKQT